MGGQGSLKGLVHNLLMQFFTLGSSKIEGFETSFFDIVITQNAHPRYVKHVLGRIYMFSTFFSGMCCSAQILCGVDLRKAIEFSKLVFFDILIT